LGGGRREGRGALFCGAGQGCTGGARRVPLRQKGRGGGGWGQEAQSDDSKGVAESWGGHRVKRKGGKRKEDKRGEGTKRGR